jgi:hypothetical protein
MGRRGCLSTRMSFDCRYLSPPGSSAWELLSKELPAYWKAALNTEMPMKKARKLALSRETLRHLEDRELTAIPGVFGASNKCTLSCSCTMPTTTATCI